jgi:hypothetical protein
VRHWLARVLRRTAVATALGTIAAVLVGLGGAEPAGAHGVGGLEPTNYETRVDGVTPETPGIEVDVVDLDAIQLRNTTDRVVTVLGYEREPYLRIGPRGVFENTRSPAVFLNRTRIPEREAPHDRYDADAAPRWRQVDDEPVATWHDHRTHFMGSHDPPAVEQDPDRTHVVIPNWRVPLDYGDTRLAITGDALWVPGPSPWPWVVLAVGLAAVVGVLARTRVWVRVMEAALAILVVSESIHVVGAWQASSASLGSRALESLYSLGGIVVSLLALLWLRGRDPYAATPAVLVAGLFVFVAGGLADVTALTRSQLPTSLPVDLARLTVTVALGLGAGLVIAAAGRLKAPQPPLVPEPAPPVPTLVR